MQPSVEKQISIPPGYHPGSISSPIFSRYLQTDRLHRLAASEKTVGKGSRKFLKFGEGICPRSSLFRVKAQEIRHERQTPRGGMTMNAQKHNSFNYLTTVSTLILMLAISGTTTATAGWFSEATGKARSTANTAVQRVSTTPRNISATAKERADDAAGRVGDIYAKLDEMYEEVRAQKPVMERFRNGPVIQGIEATLGFIEEKQHDYQQFADRYAASFRQDLQEMFGDMQGIIQDFPAFGNDDAGQRLYVAMDLIDRLPTQFLYLLHEGVGTQLGTMQDTLLSIHSKLAELPDLPTQRDLIADPFAYKLQVCPLVTDERTATHVATVQALLKTLSHILKSIKELMPSDLTITVNAVAGAGTTVATHPARVPWHVAGNVIVDGIDLTITNIVTIAASMCTIQDQNSVRYGRPSGGGYR
jgi:hypothetical protein